ncbi:MAG: diguanylate cyclase [Tenericutes bacterium]|nr:diguanylate cyclase [Mycoplasmatota bacterium]
MKHLSKTYILISAFILIIFALIVGTFIFTTNLIEEKQTEHLIYQRKNTKLEIEYYFQHIENTLSDLELYILEDKYNDDDLLQYMVSIANENDLFYSIYLGKPDKTMINSSGFTPGPEFDLTTRPWYEMAVANIGIVHTPGYLNATEDKIIINVAKAIYLNDQLYGVLSTDIDISDISSAVHNTKVGKNGFAFLIDNDNHLIAYHGLDTENLSLVELQIENFDMSSFDEIGFTDSVKINDNEGVLAHTKIANGQYILGVFLPMNEYSSPITLVQQVFIITFSIFFISLLVIFLLYYRHIDEPFRNLVDSILKIDINLDPSYRIDEVNRKDFGSIINAINQALDSTEFYISKNLESKHQLTIDNQRVKLLMESTADIIFEIDMNKRFVSVFGKGIKKLNLSSQDFIGRTIKEVFGNDGNDRDIVYTNALKGAHSIYDWQHQLDEKTLYFESSISPIYNEENEIVGAVGISRDITEAMERQKQIKYISNHDFLTGLYNRRYFVKSFGNLNENHSCPLGLMMMDLNGLKLLNDAYGHAKGDLALKQTADIIKMHSPENSTVARIGGDEFAVIIPKATTEILETFKKKVQSALSDVKIHNIPLSIAVGFDTCKHYDNNLEELIKNAENLMYRNKVIEGKNVRNNSINAIYETLINRNEREKIHSEKVAEISKNIGKAMNIKSDDLKELELASLYHDIGKISMPDAILNKPKELNKEERTLMKKHTENGYNILRATDHYSNLATYALSHHEWWNGKGYPQGLKGEEIPLFSRIISLADSYEAMTANRTYKIGISEADAIKEILSKSGSQFDPKIVKIFIHKVLNKKIS